MAERLQVSVKGLDELGRRFHKLDNFRAAAKPAVQAALDVVADAERREIRQGPTGQARKAVGTHIHSAKWGVYGNAGPRGTGRFRNGFLAALFLSSGTGVEGPKHKRITGRNKNKTALWGRRRVMAFPSSQLAASRFHVASYTGKSGRVRARFRHGEVTAFATSTRGMKAQPWYPQARAAAEGPARQAAFDSFDRFVQASGGYVDWAAVAAALALKFAAIPAIRTATADVRESLPTALPAAVVLPPAFDMAEDGGVYGYEDYTARFPFVVVFAATGGVEAVMAAVYAVLGDIPAVFRTGRTLGGAAISSSLTRAEPDEVAEWGDPGLPGIRGEITVSLHVQVARSA